MYRCMYHCISVSGLAVHVYLLLGTFVFPARDQFEITFRTCYSEKIHELLISQRCQVGMLWCKA